MKNDRMEIDEETEEEKQARRRLQKEKRRRAAEFVAREHGFKRSAQDPPDNGNKRHKTTAKSFTRKTNQSAATFSMGTSGTPSSTRRRNTTNHQKKKTTRMKRNKQTSGRPKEPIEGPLHSTVSLFQEAATQQPQRQQPLRTPRPPRSLQVNSSPAQSQRRRPSLPARTPRVTHRNVHEEEDDSNDQRCRKNEIPVPHFGNLDKQMPRSDTLLQITNSSSREEQSESEDESSETNCRRQAQFDEFASADEGWEEDEDLSQQSFVIETMNPKSNTNKGSFWKTALGMLIVAIILPIVVPNLASQAALSMMVVIPQKPVTTTVNIKHTCFETSTTPLATANYNAPVSGNPACATVNVSDPSVEWLRCPSEAVCLNGTVVGCSGVYELYEHVCRPNIKANNTLESIHLLLLEWSSDVCPVDSKANHKTRPSFSFHEIQNALGALHVSDEDKDQILELGLLQKVFLWHKNGTEHVQISLHPAERIQYSNNCNIKRHLYGLWQWVWLDVWKFVWERPFSSLGCLFVLFLFYCTLARRFKQNRENKELKLHVETALNVVYDLLQQNGSVSALDAWNRTIRELRLRRRRNFFDTVVWPRVLRTVEKDGRQMRVEVFTHNGRRQHRWSWIGDE